MDYDLIVVKTLERVYKNYYYIIRGLYKVVDGTIGCTAMTYIIKHLLKHE